MGLVWGAGERHGREIPEPVLCAANPFTVYTAEGLVEGQELVRDTLGSSDTLPPDVCPELVTVLGVTKAQR